MKRKQWLILGSLIVLGFGTYYALYLKNQSSTLNVKDTEFSVPDTANVTKLFFASKLGWSSTLEKINGVWFINRTYKANPGMVKMILGTMKLQRIKRPVFSGERNTVIKNIATKGVKVEVYSNGELNKTFYVGGNTNDAEGTYFIMEGSENPFVVYLPGLKGFINNRYMVKEDDYRDSQVFGSSAKSIVKVSVNYPKNQESSFLIENQNGQLVLHGQDDYDQIKVDNYILNYKNTHIWNFFDLDNEKNRNAFDSISTLVPDAEIELTDKKPGFSNSIKIYFDPNNPDGGFGIANISGDQKFVSYQDYVFRNLLVPSEFFKASVN